MGGVLLFIRINSDDLEALAVHLVCGNSGSSKAGAGYCSSAVVGVAAVVVAVVVGVAASYIARAEAARARTRSVAFMLDGLDEIG